MPLPPSRPCPGPRGRQADPPRLPARSSATLFQCATLFQSWSMACGWMRTCVVVDAVGARVHVHAWGLQPARPPITTPAQPPALCLVSAARRRKAKPILGCAAPRHMSAAAPLPPGRRLSAAAASAAGGSSLVCRLSSAVSRLPPPVSRVPCPASRLPSPVSRLSALGARLPHLSRLVTGPRPAAARPLRQLVRPPVTLSPRRQLCPPHRPWAVDAALGPVRGPVAASVRPACRCSQAIGAPPPQSLFGGRTRREGAIGRSYGACMPPQRPGPLSTPHARENKATTGIEFNKLSVKPQPTEMAMRGALAACRLRPCKRARQPPHCEPERCGASTSRPMPIDVRAPYETSPGRGGHLWPGIRALPWPLPPPLRQDGRDEHPLRSPTCRCRRRRRRHGPSVSTKRVSESAARRPIRCATALTCQPGRGRASLIGLKRRRLTVSDAICPRLLRPRGPSRVPWGWSGHMSWPSSPTPCSHAPFSFRLGPLAHCLVLASPFVGELARRRISEQIRGPPTVGP